MICTLIIQSDELSCLKEVEPVKPIVVMFPVILSGKEIVPIISKCKISMENEIVGQLLTVSDWTYLQKVINQNITYNADFIGHKLQQGI